MPDPVSIVVDPGSVVVVLEPVSVPALVVDDVSVELELPPLLLELPVPSEEVLVDVSLDVLDPDPVDEDVEPLCVSPPEAVDAPVSVVVAWPVVVVIYVLVELPPSVEPELVSEPAAVDVDGSIWVEDEVEV